MLYNTHACSDMQLSSSITMASPPPPFSSFYVTHEGGLVSSSCSSSKEKNKKGSGKRGGGGSASGTIKLSTDPQSIAARERRHRISDRFRILKSLVPGGSKMDTVSMLEEAIHYVKFLKAQIWLHQAAMTHAVVLPPDSHHPFAPNPNIIPVSPSQLLLPSQQHPLLYSSSLQPDQDDMLSYNICL